MVKPSERSQKRKRHRRRLLVEHLGDRRVLAAITGAVFEDLNHSFRLDAGDLDAPHRLVYIDANQNAEIDAGEPYALADAEGKFRFDDIADGTYELRLYNGTETQYQTTPVLATREGPVLELTGGMQLVAADRTPIALTHQSLVFGNLDTGVTSEVAVGSQLSKMQALPGGDLLVIGSGANSETTWQVDAATGTSTPLNLTQSETPISWADLAIDNSGRGVLLEPTNSPETGESLLAIRELDASNAETITVSEVLHTVPANARVVASSGNRSVFAWSGSEGTQLSLWSNSTASFISNSDGMPSLTSELLAFDDAAGIIAVRTQGGGLGIYDADANFAPLHTLPDVTGPIAIDGARDLLFSLSSNSSSLQLLDLRDGSIIADMAVDLSTIGQVSSLALGDRSDSVTVLGAAGIAEIALRRADAQKVTVSGNADIDSVLFGIGVDGANTAPSYDPAAPIFTTQEDRGFLRLAPAALAHSSDAETNEYVVIQRGPAGNGVAIISVDGMFSYTPHANFHGFDTVDVSLHDGRDVSPAEPITILVESVPDSPTGISSDIDDIAEDLLADEIIGNIEVIDADGLGGMPHIINVDDPRFIVDDGNLIFVGGGLDFETEPTISLTITATDVETDTTIESSVSVTILDANDPIDGISPATAQVDENSVGALVCSIEVSDPDANDTHSLTVDDARFRILDGNLYLAEGVSLDYEQTSMILVNVTAVDSGGETLTAPIRVTVVDIAEQPTTIQLSAQSVMEWVRGAPVGSISVDGKTASDRFLVSVSDSRFEIAGSLLKLRDSEMLNRNNQDQISLTVSVSDTLSEFQRISREFVIEVHRNLAPNHNTDDPYDVDDNGQSTARDALLILNHINIHGPGSTSPEIAEHYLDVNKDGVVTPLDALLLLNHLNRLATSGTVGNGEGTPEGEQFTPKDFDDEVGENPASEPHTIPVNSDTNPSSNNSGELPSPISDGFEAIGAEPKAHAERVDHTLRLLSEEGL